MAAVVLAQANADHLPLADESVDMVLTSPPYFNLRDYNEPDQIGLEAVHDCLGWATQKDCGVCFICHLRIVAREIYRTLKKTGTLWLVIGDSYNAAGRSGHGTRTGDKQQTNRASAAGQDICRPTAPGLKPKDLCGIPARVSLALQSDGWTWRSDIIWSKVNAMPNSQQDRPTSSYEHLLLFSKQARYFWDQDAVREPSSAAGLNEAIHGYRWGKKPNGTAAVLFANGTHGRGGPHDPTVTREAFSQHGGRMLRDVWTLTTQPTPYAHFATMPTEVARRCILAGSSAYGVCAACGTPWTRVVTRQRLLDGHLPVTGAFSRPDEPCRFTANGVGHWRVQTQTTAHGWQPGCACAAPVTPAVVLDPFCGSGTTVRVAQDLGRTGVGVDLSFHYLRTIAHPRIYGATLPLFATGLDR